MFDFDSCQSNHTPTDDLYNWQASVKLCKIYCGNCVGLHEVCVQVGGRTLRHNQIFRMDSLSNFVTHSATLRARELRDNYGLFSEQNVEMGELWVNV